MALSRERTADSRHADVLLGGRRVRKPAQEQPGHLERLRATTRTSTAFDFTPQIRFPFKRWQWFTVNTTAAWRETAYSRSLVGRNDASVVTDDPLNRQFFTLSAQIIGPVFNRIWDTPDNGYAEKFKHTVEPFLNISRTSAIDNFNRIIQIDGTDTIVGGSTQYTYGLNNRFYAKRPGDGGRRARRAKFSTWPCRRRYYTELARVAIRPAVFIRATTASAAEQLLADPVHVSRHAEQRPQRDRERSKSTAVTWPCADFGQRHLQLDRPRSDQRQLEQAGLIEELPGFNNQSTLDARRQRADQRPHAGQRATADLLVQLRRDAGQDPAAADLGVLQLAVLRHRVRLSAVQLRAASPPDLPVPSDHRFFLSFTLAGLGNFSPFSGAMSGVPR